jgi:hypothetical protein
MPYDNVGDLTAPSEICLPYCSKKMRESRKEKPKVLWTALRTARGMVGGLRDFVERFCGGRRWKAKRLQSSEEKRGVGAVEAVATTRA